MARARNPRQVHHEACVIAQEHGLLIEHEHGVFYRVLQPKNGKNKFLGRRGSPASLRDLVCSLTNFK